MNCHCKRKQQQRPAATRSDCSTLPYPSKDFNCFKRWIRHSEAMSQMIIWDDARQRAVLPTCLNNYGLDGYYNLPVQFFNHEQGQPAPTIDRKVNALNNRIGELPNA